MLADWPMTLSDFIHTTIRPSIGEDEEIGAGWFSSGHEEEDTAGGWNVDIDIDSPLPERGKALGHFLLLQRSEGIHEQWSKCASTAGEWIAAGIFDEAVAFLHDMVGVRRSELLRDLFVEVYVSANAALDIQWLFLAILISISFRSFLVAEGRSNLDIFETQMGHCHQHSSNSSLRKCGLYV